MYIVQVDDNIVISPDMARIEHMKAILFDMYEIHDLGKLHDYLGLAITRDRENHTMYIDQHVYHSKILRKYHLDNCILTFAPMVNIEDFRPSTTTMLAEQCHLYQGMIGSILYSMVWTKLDLSK